MLPITLPDDWNRAWDQFNRVEDVHCVVKIHQFYRIANFPWLLWKYDAVRSIYQCCQLYDSKWDRWHYIRVYYCIYNIPNAATNVIRIIAIISAQFVEMNNTIMTLIIIFYRTSEYFLNTLRNIRMIILAWIISNFQIENFHWF